MGNILNTFSATVSSLTGTLSASLILSWKATSLHDSISRFFLIYAIQLIVKSRLYGGQYSFSLSSIICGLRCMWHNQTAPNNSNRFLPPSNTQQFYSFLCLLPSQKGVYLLEAESMTKWTTSYTWFSCRTWSCFHTAIRPNLAHSCIFSPCEFQFHWTRSQLQLS